MLIEEYADIIRANIIITRYSNQSNRYTVSFENTEIKDGSILIGLYGTGKNIDSAVNNYIEKIKGKIIVIDAEYKELRREYGVPETLTNGISLQ